MNMKTEKPYIDEAGFQRNIWGIEPHVTDMYVHCNDAYPVRKCLYLREAWDKISDKESLHILLDAAYDEGYRHGLLENI